MKLAGTILAGAVVVFAAMQLVRPQRTNPPTNAEDVLQAPTEVSGILVRACNDCHSNQTRWPGYSSVAPISWLVVHDVNDGREALNFSTWNRLTEVQRKKLLGESCEEVKEGEMPPWTYLLAHPAARLDSAEKEAICAWAKQ